MMLDLVLEDVCSVVVKLTDKQTRITHLQWTPKTSAGSRSLVVQSARLKIATNSLLKEQICLLVIDCSRM